MPFLEWVRLLGLESKVTGSPSDFEVSSVSIDTRTLNEGDVFFALKGDSYDGHDFIPQAFESGAAACVVREDWRGGVAVSHEKALLRARDPLQALQTLATNYRKRFSIPVLGLTGTNGKTTTKEMIAAILETKFDVAKTPGNLNNHIGTPLSLLEMDGNSEIAIIEMGMNHPREISRLCQMAAPTYGLITNIGEGHLEFFTGIEELARAKGELFEALPEDGMAFVNADDPWVVKTARPVKGKMTYGFSQGNDIVAKELGPDRNGCERLRLQNRVDIQLQIPGHHQLQNALAAAAVGIHFGVSNESIAKALQTYQGISKRMELIEFRDAVIILDAYNSNPDSLKPSLETLTLIVRNRGGRALAALGDMLELGAESERAHREAGEFAAKLGVHGMFLFGDASGFTLEEFRGRGGKFAKHFGNKKSLAQEVFQMLAENDVLLIKGSRGMQMEDVWQELQNLAGQQKNSHGES